MQMKQPQAFARLKDLLAVAHSVHASSGIICKNPEVTAIYDCGVIDHSPPIHENATTDSISNFISADGDKEQ